MVRFRSVHSFPQNLCDCWDRKGADCIYRSYHLGQPSQGYLKSSPQLRINFSLHVISGLTSSGLEGSQWSQAWQSQQRSVELGRGGGETGKLQQSKRRENGQKGSMSFAGVGFGMCARRKMKQEVQCKWLLLLPGPQEQQVGGCRWEPETGCSSSCFQSSHSSGQRSKSTEVATPSNLMSCFGLKLVPPFAAVVCSGKAKL